MMTILMPIILISRTVPKNDYSLFSYLFPFLDILKNIVTNIFLA